MRGTRSSLLAAVLSGLASLALACQSEAAPKLGSEPAPAPSPSTPVAATPVAAAPAAAAPVTAAPAAASPSAAPTAAVGLAKYEAGAVTAAPGNVAQSNGEAAASSAGEKPAPSADAPAAKPVSGQAVQGAEVSEVPFSIWLQSVSPISAGSAGTVEAVLVAKPPYHCNAEYPHKFKLAAAPAGLSYPETTVKGMKVTAERSVLPIPVRAQSPGKAKVSGTLSFSVCDDERCLVEKRDLSLELEVK